MKVLLSTCLLFCFYTSPAQQSYFLLVGTYTSAGSRGIYVYDFDSGNANTKLTDSARASNPSFLAISPDERFVYTVSEDAAENNHGGRILSFSFNNHTGALTRMNEQSSKGNNPCYVAVDKTGRWVIGGNYSSGTLAVLPVRKNGSLDTAVSFEQHTGSSVNTERQNEPHVHSTVLSPDNKFLFVPDLGLDKIMAYRFNDKTGALTKASPAFVMTKPGSGPRHLTFHPNKKFAYLAEELTGSVSAYSYSKSGSLTLIQNISAQPPEYMGPAGSADIHVSPDGKFLYISNRAETNTIGIFSIAKNTGWLTAVGYQSTLGKTPRNFNFDPTGNFLLVANQNSDEIVIFKVDKETGLLTDTGKRVGVSKPVCIKWIRKQ